ncbi:XRE family transcriptional regulator [Kineobactrum sediminis]|uniref:XRE family transcriptional regulator n=1 Tax=Kineobactrum sediminis TaxID=1905677 RepID=A0A2N5Y3V0_9GAMM|nr:XRE family transcriptional regulator [Kineobactrum sediminis]PLW83062.1 XRE family transcriptional regulator [Kineobactrum sediminis]
MTDDPSARPAPDPAGRVLSERVTALRQSSSFTLEQLAAASGVSRSMLSQIERGQANPTLAVTFRIAKAFGLTIGELVDDPAASGLIEVVRGDDPTSLFRADPECQIRTLSPLHMEKNVEFYELKIQPGASLDSAPHFNGTRELFTVTAGQAAIVTGAAECTLAAGDSAHYRADVEHSIRATGEVALQGYLVVTYK